ncbi:MAG: metallophosphatase domain-containing protein [Bacteroidales bacterium]|nr:metallophosphatase domain-containing protein [Bacteroidales bacterium]
MKILHISDTHNAHKRLANLPEGDLIIHSGDISQTGSESEILDFINWFQSLPYPNKIFTYGNHDFALFDAENIEGLDSNCYFLANKSITVNGYHIHAIPYYMDMPDFNPQVPVDTDILITHNPPKGILDLSGDIHYGSNQLRDLVAKLQPKLHLFGHIHDAYGQMELDGTLYSNGACVDENYEPRSMQYNLIVLP